MAEALLDYKALREATRVRLSPAARKALEWHAEINEAIAADGGDKNDQLVANGLRVLLNMHDKLEAIDRG